MGKRRGKKKRKRRRGERWNEMKGKKDEKFLKNENFLTCPRGTSSIAVSPPAASKASTRSLSSSPPSSPEGLNQRVSPGGRPRSSGTDETRPSMTTSLPESAGESETLRGEWGGGRRAGVGRRCVGWTER